MRWKRFVLMFSALLPIVSQRTAVAQSDAQKHLEALGVASSLVRSGLKPWHLRVSFELYDLAGMPKEAGTIEEWWTSPNHRKLLVQSPSYNVTSGQVDDAARHTRAAYLINELVSQIVRPIPDYGNFDHLQVTESGEDVGKAKLTCLQVFPSKLKEPPTGGVFPKFCVDPGTDNVRIESGPGSAYVVRNRMAKFQNTIVALDDAISYGQHLAITGHVDALETFAPEAEMDDVTTEVASVPGIVQAGKIIKSWPPTYPSVSGTRRPTGSVVLGAVISKTGTVTTLFVVASPDETLSGAAMEAVKLWTFQPAMLNGVPSAIDTTISVNFGISR